MGSWHGVDNWTNELEDSSQRDTPDLQKLIQHRADAAAQRDRADSRARYVLYQLSPGEKMKLNPDYHHIFYQFQVVYCY